MILERRDMMSSRPSTARLRSAHLSPKPPDIVMTDLTMPVLNGEGGLIERLRSRPSTAAIPIVVVSGNPAAARALHASGLVEAFVIKPFGAIELAACIQAIASRFEAVGPAAGQLVSRHVISSAVDSSPLPVDRAGLEGGLRLADIGVLTLRKPIRIVIVEDQRLIADALEALLSRQPGMVVVANLRSVAESALRVAELNPDVVILDFREKDEVAVAAVKAICQAEFRDQDGLSRERPAREHHARRH